jgi:crotonobetainyl-CoA:carnitine CoA-transferase CaiB-like acyl-CoA transferase
MADLSFPSDFFRGLRVVELASVLAGPAVGLFFAELGADVIKVENRRTAGDVTRRWKGPTEDARATDSAYYHSVNYGKQSHLLDLSDPADQQQVYEWIKTADIVVANFKPGGAGRLGMDYPTLRDLNPALIYAEITGFGRHDRRPAFDVVLQAESGFLYLTGEPGREPVKLPVALIDLLAAHQLKEGVLLALLRRERTGQGGMVEVSLYDAAIASLANQGANWLVAGYSPKRIGAQHPNIAPYGDLFITADKHLIVLAVGTEGHFRELCTLLGAPELPALPDFATNADRVRHRDALNEALAPLIRQQPRQALLDQLWAHGIPAGAVRDLPAVFADPLTQPLLLTTRRDDGQPVPCVRSVVFKLS